MKKIRFIHTADVHLGSFLHVAGELLPPTLEKLVSEATREGFRRVCNQVLENEVDFLVISGDLYDREARSVQAQKFFVEQCGRLAEAEIPVYVIAGNHDPLRERQELFIPPNNVHILGGDRPEVHEVLDSANEPIARIIGQSYRRKSESKKMHLDYPLSPNDLWNIALLHTQLDSGSNYVPCSLGELKDRCDLHYWALGHLHQYQVLNANEFPLIAYPGIPQGRDFGETGRGGCLQVELAGAGQNSLEFIPLAPVVFQRMELFIDQDPENSLETLSDLEEQISAEGERLLEQIGTEDYPIEGYIVEWIIRGRGVLHQVLQEQREESLETLTVGLRNRFAGRTPFLWTNSLTARTGSPLDYTALLEGSSTLKELDEVFRQCSQDELVRDDLHKELGIIWRGTADRENHQEKDDFRFYLDQETLQEFLAGARHLILEALAERRGRQ